MRCPFKILSLAALTLIASASAIAASVQTVIEYYDAHDDLYFITASPTEAAVIDSGAVNVGPSTWSRTGYSFFAFSSPGPGNDVCRFYDPSIPPVGVHFYTALPPECASVQASLPAWHLETGSAFNIPLPVNGSCATGFLPVIRYFDQRANESWRFITDPSVNAAMLAKGWDNEGVQMCSPPSTGSVLTNVTAMTVDPGPANTFNVAFVTVTVCVPNTTNCQTVDHIQVDTNSTGLRIISSVLPASFALPEQIGVNQDPIAECSPLPAGFSWGSVRLADVQIAGEQAHAVPVQIIGDTSFIQIPPECSSLGVEEDTVASLGANGVLGVSATLQDCGAICVSIANENVYYVCQRLAVSTCQPTVLSLSQQLNNPVALFASDNNGILLELPSVPASGAASVTGSLVFGIGTQPNNGLGGAQVFPVDTSMGEASGTLTTSLNIDTVDLGYFDTGSKLNVFNDASLAQCQAANFVSYYCPLASTTVSAVNQGSTGAPQGAISFTVANAANVLGGNPTFAAFTGLAGPGPANTWVWGMPFFFGRNVYLALEGMKTPAGNGPYIAY